MPGNSRTQDAPASAEAPTGVPSASVLFGVLWDALADVLGTAATAILLRRAFRQLEAASGIAADVIIEREDLVYRYRLPESWLVDGDVSALETLRGAGRELVPLLRGLTGPVVVRRLARVPELLEARVLPAEEGSW